MEQHLCRKLLDSEIVHHLNGNKLDNRLENLQITKREDHIEIHRSKQWSVEHDKCIKCGTVSIKHEGHGFCEKCYKTPYKKRNTGPKWSLKFDRCIECGQTSSRHEGKGVCNRCTQRKKSKKTMK